MGAQRALRAFCAQLHGTFLEKKDRIQQGANTVLKTEAGDLILEGKLNTIVSMNQKVSQYLSKVLWLFDVRQVRGLKNF